MKIEDIKCDWLTRLAKLRRKQDKNSHKGNENLIEMFLWVCTPEGFDFWECVYLRKINNKEEAFNWLLKEMVIAQDEDGTYFFVNEKETDKIYNE